MRIQKFEELIAWQKAQDIAVDVYESFKELKDWSFKDQIGCAAVSISNNIAEGFDRHSNKEFIRFFIHFFRFHQRSEVYALFSQEIRLSEYN